MFGFFGRLRFRSECTDQVVIFAGINRTEAAKFVEWYKALIEYGHKNGLAPENAVVAACVALLKHPEQIDKPEHFMVIGMYAMGVINANPGSEIADTLSGLLKDIENNPLVQEWYSVFG